MREAEEEYEIRKEFSKESLKTDLKLLQERFIRQQKVIVDIDIDMTNFIRNQNTEDNAVNIIQRWRKEWQAAGERAKTRFKKKEKWLKENWKIRKIKQTYNKINI